jgi:hypothetical protein
MFFSVLIPLYNIQFIKQLNITVWQTTIVTGVNKATSMIKTAMSSEIVDKTRIAVIRDLKEGTASLVRETMAAIMDHRVVMAVHLIWTGEVLTVVRVLTVEVGAVPTRVTGTMKGWVTVVGVAHKATGTEIANAVTGKAALAVPEVLVLVMVPGHKVAGAQVLIVIQEEGTTCMARKVACMVLKVPVNMEAQDLLMVREWASMVELLRDMDPVVTADLAMDHLDTVLQARADWAQLVGAAPQDLQVAMGQVVNLEEDNPADMVPAVWDPAWVLVMEEWEMTIEDSGIRPGMKYHHGLVMKKLNVVVSVTGGWVIWKTGKVPTTDTELQAAAVSEIWAEVEAEAHTAVKDQKTTEGPMTGSVRMYLTSLQTMIG